MTTRVFLKHRRSKPFWYGEPWVYDASIDRIKGRRDLKDGDLVELADHEGKTIGVGFFNSRSRIVVRVVSLGDSPVNDELIARRVERAISLRVDTLKLQDDRTDAFRVIHAEGDGLPGLIVDKLGDILVCCFDSLGMRQFRDVILGVLKERLQPRTIVERFSRVAREEEGIEGTDGVIFGDEEHAVTTIRELGIEHTVNVLLGQKTGYFTDQRDNRQFLAGLARGRRCLDAFCYTGGFSMALEKIGGAEHVVAVDSSQPALDVLIEDAARAGLTHQEPIKANVLRHLDHAAKASERFGLVNLDPPKIVRRAKDLSKGLRLYHEINTKGLSVCEDGAIFATSSCSGAVSSDEFERMVAQAAFTTGVRVQLIHSGGAGADHPVLVPHDRSRYLKFRAYRVFSLHRSNMGK